MLVGTVLFPAHSNSVSVICLPLFVDFQKASIYIWGSAVLAFLYRELCSAMNLNRQMIGGMSDAAPNVVLAEILLWKANLLGQKLNSVEF